MIDFMFSFKDNWCYKLGSSILWSMTFPTVCVAYESLLVNKERNGLPHVCTLYKLYILSCVISEIGYISYKLQLSRLIAGLPWLSIICIPTSDLLMRWECYWNVCFRHNDLFFFLKMHSYFNSWIWLPIVAIFLLFGHGRSCKWELSENIQNDKLQTTFIRRGG